VDVAQPNFEPDDLESSAPRLERRPYRCPQCDAHQWLRVVYGLPSGELLQEAEEGRVALGGCVLPYGEPEERWRCSNCGFGWAPLIDSTTAV